MDVVGSGGNIYAAFKIAIMLCYSNILIDSCYILSHKNLLKTLKYWSIEVGINNDNDHKTNNYLNCCQQWYAGSEVNFFFFYP